MLFPFAKKISLSLALLMFVLHWPHEFLQVAASGAEAVEPTCRSEEKNQQGFFGKVGDAVAKGGLPTLGIMGAISSLAGQYFFIKNGSDSDGAQALRGFGMGTQAYFAARQGAQSWRPEFDPFHGYQNQNFGVGEVDPRVVFHEVQQTEAQLENVAIVYYETMRHPFARRRLAKEARQIESRLNDLEKALIQTGNAYLKEADKLTLNPEGLSRVGVDRSKAYKDFLQTKKDLILINHQISRLHNEIRASATF